MKAITVRAGWAWAIMQGIKRVENRTGRVHYRGRLAIHAAKSARWDNADRAELLRLTGIEAPAELVHGAVVGTVELVDIVTLAEPDPAPLFPDVAQVRADPLATGPECWRLENPRPLPDPLPCAGQQSLWESPLLG